MCFPLLVCHTFYALFGSVYLSFLLFGADDKDAITASRDAIIQSRKPPPKPPVSHSYKKTVATVAALGIIAHKWGRA